MSGLPKRLTQDESELCAIEFLMAEFDAEWSVIAYVEDLQAYREQRRVPVWPSAWTARTGPSVKVDFESWCWGTAWFPGN